MRSSSVLSALLPKATDGPSTFARATRRRPPPDRGLRVDSTTDEAWSALPLSLTSSPLGLYRLENGLTFFGVGCALRVLRQRRASKTPGTLARELPLRPPADIVH